MQHVIGTKARTALRWAFGGLPGWLMLPGLMPRWSQMIHVNALPVHLETDRNRLVDIALGPSLVLKKQLVFPKAIKKNLARAIDLKMRQTLPSAGADLIWRYRVTHQDKTELHVDVFLLKQSVLDAITSKVSRVGAKLRMIGIDDLDLDRPFLDNRTTADRPRRVWSVLTLLLALTLAAVPIWNEYARKNALKQYVAELQSERLALSTRAVELRQKKQSEDSEFTAISRDVALFGDEYQRLPILVDLTEGFDDETWVSELSVVGPEIRLAGFTSRDITDVMSEIRALSWVDRVTLEGPVSFDSFSRRNRFDLVIGRRTSDEVSP